DAQRNFRRLSPRSPNGDAYGERKNCRYAPWEPSCGTFSWECSSRRMRHRLIEQQLPITDGLQSFLRILLQTRFKQPLHLKWGGAQVGFFLNDRCERFGQIFTVEEPLSREHFVEHDSERPDIRARSDGFAASLFGTHVRCGSQNDAGLSGGHRDSRGVVTYRCGRGCCSDFRESKVENLHRPIRLEHNVARFQIAMNDAFFMRGFQ